MRRIHALSGDMSVKMQFSQLRKSYFNAIKKNVCSCFRSQDFLQEKKKQLGKKLSKTVLVFFNFVV